MVGLSWWGVGGGGFCCVWLVVGLWVLGVGLCLDLLVVGSVNSVVIL